MNVTYMVTALSLAALPLAATAQPAPMLRDTPTLAVGGDGVLERAPDVARVALSIVTNDDNAARSAGKNTDIYNALKARASALGIAPGDVHTAAFNVRFVPPPARGLPPEQREPRYGYVTTRSLSIDVVPLVNAGKMVDAANAAGVTEIGDVNFDLRDRKGAYREALAAAWNDARANAAALATAGGFRIVRVKNVSSENARVQPYRPPGPIMMRASAAAAPSPTEIEPNGPIAVSAHVNVEFEIQ